MPTETKDVSPEVACGLTVIEELSEGVGPRPPCSEAELLATEFIRGRFEGLGLTAETEEFASGRSFGPLYAVSFGLALLGGLVQRQQGRGRRAVGFTLAATGAMSAVWESRFLPGGLASLFRRKTSRNVFTTMEPTGEAQRTVCLLSHLDSSRSGLMFHPRATPHLGALVSASGVATLLQVLAGPLRSFRSMRPLIWLSQALVAAGLGLILERELRGEDVPGANDNASGVGACLALTKKLSIAPLLRTRVVVLVTGSEESGVLGARDFLTRHDTSDWLFINFDGVGADAPLRVLSKEGGPLAPVAADPELLDLARRVGADRPDLYAEPLAHGSGLPYDSTAVLARGGRALTVVNQSGAIPDYHWPSDRMDRISPTAFSRAVGFGLELVWRIDQSG